jgi:3',5'-cyclic AMP phosphodiesterase CpdA
MHTSPSHPIVHKGPSRGSLRGSLLRPLSLLLGPLFLAIPARGAAPPPVDPPTYCFAVYGDSRSGDADHRRVVNAILAGKPAAVFHTGDMVNDGTDAGDWKEFNAITAELRQKAEFFPALGNHEKESERYFSNFGIPRDYRWYSVERGGVHVAVLDSESGLSPGSPQYAWLEKDLAQAGTPFVAVMLHTPPFSSGLHGDDGGLQRDLVPLLERSGVDVVFSGHDHDYERLEVGGIVYLVTGGGGAPLYGQRGKNKASRAFSESFNFLRVCVERGGMTVEARTPEGKVIDRVIVPLRVRPAQPRPDRPTNCCGHF